MRRCLLSCIACTLIFMLVLTSCSGPHLEISVKWKQISTTLQDSSDLTVSIPDTAEGMACETIGIPATVSNGVSPFYYEWRVKRQSDSNWNSTSGTNQTYLLNSIDADTWVCYCIVTDKDGKRAQSNICTITVTPLPEQPTVSIPLAASCKAGQILNIPATVIYGTAPYTYTWMIKRNDASEWETSSKHGQSYTRTFVEATTWDCYCIVTDKNGNTAQSNICTIIVAER